MKKTIIKKILLFSPNLVLWVILSIARSLRAVTKSTKNTFVYRSFWGRGSLHRQILHISFIGLTILILGTGLSVQISRANSVQGFISNEENVIGNIDLLEQGGSIQTVLALNTGASFRIFSHVVKDGDTLDTLVAEYGVTKRTIKDSNRDQIDYYDEKLKIGSTLYIPEVNGVLYKTKQGDTINWIMSQVNGGDLYEVLELNSVNDPHEILAQDYRLLVPNSVMPEPPKPIPDPAVIIAYAPNSSIVNQQPVDVSVLNGIAFSDPLSHPSCSGYGWSRGFTAWHNGVDLARAGGCPERAIAAGTVIYAGWGNGGQGYYVAIDHGSGVMSQYFHGDGNIWVRTGDYVSANQEIMNMGCTGWCTGTHLHLELRVNGVAIDPAPYIPYARPV